MEILFVYLIGSILGLGISLTIQINKAGNPFTSWTKIHIISFLSSWITVVVFARGVLKGMFNHEKD